MQTRFEYDVCTLREMLHAGSDALTVIEKSKEGLTSYGKVCVTLTSTLSSTWTGS